MRFAAALLALALPLGAQAVDANADEVRKQQVRVLYAGNPDDARTADFEQFLGKHFTTVGTISYEAFTPDAMRDYDVAILDWGKVYFKEAESGRLRLPKVPDLPRDFSRPMVLIGSPGIRVAEHLGARLDWL